jgi:hypothetical protein
MWILTTENELVNITQAQKIVIEAEPSGKPHTMVVLAYFVGGDRFVLARAHQPNQRYARSMAAACLKAIDESLRDGEGFCDLSDTCEEVIVLDEDPPAG